MSFYRPQAGMEQRVGNYVGIAHKAGRVAAGDALALNALKTGQAYLLLLAEDIAPTTAQELLDAAPKTPVLRWSDKISLGILVGKSRRGALVVRDEGFARAILDLCEKKDDDI